MFGPIKIITDEPTLEDSLDFHSYSQKLADIIINSTPRFAIGIFGGCGTGKTTLMLMIKKELEKKNEILSVWFNAWRYEREKHLAAIPFLRQIKIALENELKENKKTQRWKMVKSSLERTLSAFAESTELTATTPGSFFSARTSFKVFVNSLKSKGSTWMSDEQVQLHEHASDYFENALKKLRLPKSDSTTKKNSASRIVVFIDDLDRCTPEKALEVLESIKIFFDIEGIVYVIGMDSNSIDSLIKKKYGENPSVRGFDYMQKIVQLPFQIPFWNKRDIEKFVSDTIKKNLVESQFINDISNNIELLVKAIKWNPREVKRFINNIILAQAVFGKSVDELMVIQALNFRYEWNKFLEFITSNEKRQQFLNEYKKQKEQDKAIIIKDLDSFNREISEAYPSFREILDWYPLFFKQNNDLREFLDAGADEILLKIHDIEGHRRALNAVSVKGVTKKSGIGENVFIENLSSGYNVYVFYYPGMSQDEELEGKLGKLGLEEGNNLLVNIVKLHDPAYKKMTSTFGITKFPAIIVTGSEGIASLKSETEFATVYVRLDSNDLLQDSDRTIETITQIFNLFNSGRIADTLQKGIHEKPDAIKSNIRSDIVNTLKHIKKFISDKDIEVSLLDGKFELRRKD